MLWILMLTNGLENVEIQGVILLALPTTARTWA